MIKALKWAYELGRKQERLKIKLKIQHNLNAVKPDKDSWQYEKDEDKYKRDLAIYHAVSNQMYQLTQPQVITEEKVIDPFEEE